MLGRVPAITPKVPEIIDFKFVSVHLLNPSRQPHLFSTLLVEGHFRDMSFCPFVLFVLQMSLKVLFVLFENLSVRSFSPQNSPIYPFRDISGTFQGHFRDRFRKGQGHSPIGGIVLFGMSFSCPFASRIGSLVKVGWIPDTLADTLFNEPCTSELLHNAL